MALYRLGNSQRYIGWVSEVACKGGGSSSSVPWNRAPCEAKTAAPDLRTSWTEHTSSAAAIKMNGAANPWLALTKSAQNLNTLHIKL